MLFVAFSSLTRADVRRNQISVVLWECASKSLKMGYSDRLLADQLLSGLALVVGGPGNKVGNEHIDFALYMSTIVRESAQFESIVQIFGNAKISYKLIDQIRVVLDLLERFRFSASMVQRTLTALAALYGMVSEAEDSSSFTGDGHDVELVIVASGMYADSPSVQVAAVEALRAIAGTMSENVARIANVIAPAVLDQAFARNKEHDGLMLAVARLMLRLGDSSESNLDLPEAVPVLMRIVGTSTASKETQLVALAAIRVCHCNAKKNGYSVWENTGGSIMAQFVTAVETNIAIDGSIAREACLTIESLMGPQSVELRDMLTRAGVVAIPVRALKLNTAEYPRILNQILAALHACVIGNSRGAIQFAKLDGVQQVLSVAGLSGSAHWRTWALLADACIVADEVRKNFDPDSDIVRVAELADKVGKDGSGDFEVIIQAMRVAGEIAFSSNFSTKEIFEKLNKSINPWWGNGVVNFSTHCIIWAAVNRKLIPKGFDTFTRITSPNGRDLTFRLPDLVVKDYNFWVTGQGGSEVGATVMRMEEDDTVSRKTTRRKKNDGGFTGFISEMF
jgi:hypothetical protein